MIGRYLSEERLRRETDAKTCQQMQQMEELRQEFKAEKAQLLRDAQSERAVIEAKMMGAIEEQLRRPAELLSEQQFAAIQARFEALHQSQLLTDDELFALEGISADFLEFKSSAGGVVTAVTVRASDAAGRLLKLVALSEGLTTDSAFARQVRRKYIS